MQHETKAMITALFHREEPEISEVRVKESGGRDRSGLCQAVTAHERLSPRFLENWSVADLQCVRFMCAAKRFSYAHVHMCIKTHTHTQTHTCMGPPSESFPLEVITRSRVEFPVLHSRPLLGMHFLCSRVFCPAQTPRLSPRPFAFGKTTSLLSIFFCLHFEETGLSQPSHQQICP